MKQSRIRHARCEAIRFLVAVDRLQKQIVAEPGIEKYMETGQGYATTAAVRRASLDLTRALADMRKPQ